MVKHRLEFLNKEQAKIVSKETAYLIDVDWKREKIREEVMNFKECSLGYKSIYRDVAAARKLYAKVQSSQEIIDVIYETWYAKDSGEVDRQKFVHSFKDDNALYNWYIIRDYTAIFTHTFKQKKAIKS